MSRLLRLLQEAAAEHGLDAVGIAAATPVESYDRYQQWIEAGHHGQMGYMARDPQRRADPAALLEQTRSLVVVAANYRTSEPANDPGPLRGRVARYAWGADYHDVLKDDLEALARLVERESQADTRTYVDTGAILERDAGVRAGLGFAAKNTMLIRPGLGSHFFLGEILATEDLGDPDTERVRPGCGTCTICIDECPTDAITEAEGVDSRKCISYLTIELKGPIPRSLRPQMGRWIFGCDICQDCCPWNAHAHTTNREEFQAADPERISPHLPTLLAMSPQELNTRFRNTPLSRPKRRGLLRNACVALGNEGHPDAVPALLGALEDLEPLVRGHAAWALGRIAADQGGELARSVAQALERAASRENDAFAAAEIGLARDIC